MSLAFTLCWAPFGLAYFKKILNLHEPKQAGEFSGLEMLCVKLGCTVINPIVYAFEKNTVKQAYCDVLAFVDLIIIFIRFRHEIIRQLKIILHSVTV